MVDMEKKTKEILEISLHDKQIQLEKHLLAQNVNVRINGFGFARSFSPLKLGAATSRVVSPTTDGTTSPLCKRSKELPKKLAVVNSLSDAISIKMEGIPDSDCFTKSLVYYIPFFEFKIISESETIAQRCRKRKTNCCRIGFVASAAPKRLKFLSVNATQKPTWSSLFRGRS